MGAHDWVLSMGYIELNSVFMLNYIARNRTVLTFKLRTYAKLNCLKCNIMDEGFRFIYLTFGFSLAKNLSAQCMG